MPIKSENARGLSSRSRRDGAGRPVCSCTSYITGTDTYGGLDRFGRIVDQKWTDGSGSTPPLDEFTYTYDRNSNRLTKGNALAGNFSEVYTYDDLNRLIDADRNGANLQDWSLDSLGNWNGTTIGTASQTRTFDAANEITGISGTWIDPTYDAAGNMTSGPVAGDETTRQWYVYDAWNHLVEAHADFNGTMGGQIARYEYDGQGRRIEKTTADSVTLDYFWDEQYQNIETRKNDDADPIDQFVYDIRYVDAPIVRFHDDNTDGDYLDANDNTFYVMQDANWNVTGIVSAVTGQVGERYTYTPYGAMTVLDSSFLAKISSSFGWIIGHQGLAKDTETGLIYNRARYLHAGLGMFLQRDPAEYDDSTDLYQYARSMVTGHTDSQGLGICGRPCVCVVPGGILTVAPPGRPTPAQLWARTPVTLTRIGVCFWAGSALALKLQLIPCGGPCTVQVDWYPQLVRVKDAQGNLLRVELQWTALDWIPKVAGLPSTSIHSDSCR